MISSDRPIIPGVPPSQEPSPTPLFQMQAPPDTIEFVERCFIEQINALESPLEKGKLRVKFCCLKCFGKEGVTGIKQKKPSLKGRCKVCFMNFFAPFLAVISCWGTCCAIDKKKQKLNSIVPY